MVLILDQLTRAITTPTTHQAKIRAFRAVLSITEQKPDSIDPTNAKITIAACHKALNTRICSASLDPVLVSGIPTTCHYTVVVGPTKTKLRRVDC